MNNIYAEEAFIDWLKFIIELVIDELKNMQIY